MLELNIAGLKTRLVAPRGSAGTHPDSLLVLLHGYGAAGDDLVYLSEELELPSGMALVFPEGPLDLSAGAGGTGDARGWWQTDSKQFHLAMLTGQVARASNTAGSGRQVVRPVLDAFVDELQSRFRVRANQMIIGGFSQGSILCLDWALHKGESWAGLLCLSGTWVEGGDWDACLANGNRQRVLISHGRYDPILPFSLAQQLQLRLHQANWDVEFVPFDGSHSIPGEVVHAVSRAITFWVAGARVDGAEAAEACATTAAITAQLRSNSGLSS